MTPADISAKGTSPAITATGAKPPARKINLTSRPYFLNAPLSWAIHNGADATEPAALKPKLMRSSGGDSAAGAAAANPTRLEPMKSIAAICFFINLSFPYSPPNGDHPCDTISPFALSTVRTCDFQRGEKTFRFSAAESKHTEPPANNLTRWAQLR